MILARHLPLAAIALGAWLGWSPHAFAEPVTITFVQTNDVDRMEEKDGRGGFARLMSVVNDARDSGPTFFVHSGDTISPSVFSGIDKGVHIIDILNQMELDILTPGNHEFDFGPDVFRTRLAEADFDVVTSNVREKDGSQPANTTDLIITEVAGIKLGFYGLTTEDTRIVSSPGEITFAPEIATASERARTLRDQGADFVVAVVHTPISVDLAMLRAGVADLILSGHDEILVTIFNGKTALTESHSQGNFAVVSEITIDKTEKDGKVSVAWWPSFTIVDTADVEPDPEIAALVKSYEDKLGDELKVTIGTTGTPLDSRRDTVRGQEAAIGNLIADAVRQAVGAEVAIINGGAIRGDRQYDAGAQLLRGDVLAELPFGNRTVKLELTGKDLRAALENGFSMAENRAGRFPQVSGMTVEVDPKKPAGERLVTVLVGGTPLDAVRTYTLATIEFLAAGGDGYTMLKDAKALINPIDAQLVASQVIDYIAAKGTVAPKVEGRIVVK